MEKEEVEAYINDNWNSHFFKALTEHLKETMLERDKDQKEDYRQEIKQLIWEGISDGVKCYLDENQKDLIDKIAEKFGDSFEINVNINKK